MRVLFTCRPLAGHYQPLLGLATAAVKAGHDVAFASGPSVAGQARAAGFAAFDAGEERLTALVADRCRTQLLLRGDLRRAGACAARP
jgi:UDP:flavonoid glycosyltransferase YjiC (YdhE family)